MFTTVIQPRFSETDGLGHINNTVIPIWFEEGRLGIFKIFNPTLAMHSWNLILKKYDIEFCAQLFHTETVKIETSVTKIGKTSITVKQIASQNDEIKAIGTTILVHFDFATNTPMIVPEAIRNKIQISD